MNQNAPSVPTNQSAPSVQNSQVVPNQQVMPTGMNVQGGQPAQNYQHPGQAEPVLPAGSVQNMQDPAQPNPMLSRVSNPQENAGPGAPVPPMNHAQPDPGKADPKPSEDSAENTQQQQPQFGATIQELAGDLANDPYAKPALTFIQAACGDSVDLARAFGKAAEYGDPQLIDEAYLQDVLGDKAGPVVEQAKALFEYAEHVATKTLNEVYAAVGGEDRLRQAAAYFNQAADPDTKREIMYLLDSGDKELMVSAAKRVVQFAERGGMVYKPGTQPLGQPGAVRGLTHAEYIEAISQRNLSPERYEELRRLRMLGKSQGI